METITVLSEETETISRDVLSRRFDWGATIAGVAVATAVIFFLITLGSGFGLAFVSVPPSAIGLKAFLTLGAIYFFASQAFGFAAGAHITGRLIGPAGKNSKEEEFLAGAHGLVVWASTVVTSLAILAFVTLIGGTTALGGLGADSNRTVVASSSYWTDMLFRPAGNSQQSSATSRQYAQAGVPSVNDATTTNGADDANNQSEGGGSPATERAASSTGMGAMTIGDSQSSSITPNLLDDKAEATRILAVDLAQGDKTNNANRGELARLVSQDAGLSSGAAASRVDIVETDMRNDTARVAEAARKATIFISFWTAFALLFGAIVSVAAAISARWEDDRVTFSWTPRR